VATTLVRTTPDPALALRLELAGLALATLVTLAGVALGAEARLARASLALDAAPAASAVLRTPAAFRGEVAGAVALLLVGFYALHVMRRYRGHGGDGLLLPAALTLCGLGMMAMVTLRDPLRDLLLVRSFGSGVLLGCGVACVLMSVSYDRLRSFTYVPLAAALLLAVALVVLGSGPGGSGAKVNLWGGQPVEVIRLLEVQFLAAYLGSRWEYLRTLSDPHVGRTRLMSRFHVPHLDYLLPLLLCLAATLLFYVAQADLGPALIMACLFMAMYAVATRRVGLVLVGLSILCAAFWVGYRFGVAGNVGARVAIWLSPFTSGVRGGDQVAHGLWAFASGGATGRGAGLGETAFVPAAHTDFALAALGEELGFVGVAATLLLFALVAWRGLRIAERAAGDYSRFLALGITLCLVLQFLLIAGGILALVPLSGVAAPFLSYGKSAMTVNLAGIGILLAIASRASPTPAPAFRRPIRCLAALLAVLGVAVAGRAWQMQVQAADRIVATPVLARLADGTFRLENNPRFLSAVRELLPRGRIFDRKGLPLALTNAEVARYSPQFVQVGIDLEEVCRGSGTRCYPFGGRTEHVLGDLRSERDWAAGNTSFVERDLAARLRGFDDHARPVTVAHPDGQGSLRLTRRDYAELIPLVRYRYRPGHADVQRLVTRQRDVTVSLDARLQDAVATLMEERFKHEGYRRGAAIVMDVASRDVLAAVSYPWPGATDDEEGEDPSLDRVRYGLYPPGSIFKLVTAVAALRADPSLAHHPFMCARLPDHRVGRQVQGWRIPVHDDRSVSAAHGALTLADALVVSCNAYFAQLAVRVGVEAMRGTAADFDISTASRNSSSGLRGTLPYAGFGQGEVVTTPARFAGVVAAIASGGLIAPARWVLDPAPAAAAPRRVVAEREAADLARAMRAVVTRGTGRVLNANSVAIAGKTGSAELDERQSHAWFAGFAPYEGAGPQIAFVVLIENGGSGGRAAAPLAGDIVDIARQLEIVE
jgi:cell division protein FtsW (lipid II flippase)